MFRIPNKEKPWGKIRVHGFIVGGSLGEVAHTRRGSQDRGLEGVTMRQWLIFFTGVKFIYGILGLQAHVALVMVVSCSRNPLSGGPVGTFF